MARNKHVKIQLTAGSPSMDVYTQQLMVTAMGEFISESDPQSDDCLVFEFSYKDHEGTVHQLNPYRVTRPASVRAVKEAAKQ